MRTVLIIIILGLPAGLLSQELDNYTRITDLGAYIRATPQQRAMMGGEAYGTNGTPYVYGHCVRYLVDLVNKMPVLFI